MITLLHLRASHLFQTIGGTGALPPICFQARPRHREPQYPEHAHGTYIARPAVNFHVTFVGCLGNTGEETQSYTVPVKAVVLNIRPRVRPSDRAKMEIQREGAGLGCLPMTSALARKSSWRVTAVLGIKGLHLLGWTTWVRCYSITKGRRYEYVKFVSCEPNLRQP